MLISSVLTAAALTYGCLAESDTEYGSQLILLRGKRSVHEIFESRDAFLDWSTGPGLRIIVIVLSSLLAVVIARHVIDAAVHPRLLGTRTPLAPGEIERLRRRELTVESFLRRAAAVFIGISALLMVLTEVGVSVTPLIASAGVVGVAVGLGTQTLVRDAIAGIFMLLEDQYDVGDRVRLNDVEGRVVALSIRRTSLEGDDGALYTIPNGEISVTTNLRNVRTGRE